MMRYTETDPDIATTSFEVSEVIFSGTTAVGQKVDVVRGPHFGAMIFIDGEGQSAQEDEFIYHEALVHPVMAAGPPPETVLIVGGGEGATAREVLRWPSVRRVKMVDFDREFVELCRTKLPSWSAGAFDDPRLEVAYEDINTWEVRMREPAFDVVIVDLPDSFLLDSAFMTMIRSWGGRVAVQTGAFSPFQLEEVHRRAGIGAVLYRVYVPFFQSEWSFALLDCCEAPDITPVFPAGLRSWDPRPGVPMGALGPFQLPPWARDSSAASLRSHGV